METWKYRKLEGNETKFSHQNRLNFSKDPYNFILFFVIWVAKATGHSLDPHVNYCIEIDDFISLRVGRF